MGSVNLTSTTLAPPPTTRSARPGVPDRSAAAPSADCATGTFGGLRWHYRPGCEGPLLAVAAAAWSAPETQGWQRVKCNARREVWRAEIAGATCYLKYHLPERGLRAVTRLFRDGACRTEWDGGLYALQAGIAAVQPIAFTTDLRRRGRRCELLITQALEPARPLSEFWLQLCSDEDPARRRSDTRQLTELLAEMIARAHQAGFEHLDMHAANILVQTVAPRRYRTAFVDLQSARRGVPLSDRAVVRNLAQLNQWFRRHSTIGERLRFLRAYLRWRNEFEAVSPHGRPLGLSFARLVAALSAAARSHAERLGARRDRRARRRGRYFARFRLPGGWRVWAVVRCKHPSAESHVSQLELDEPWWRARLADPLRRLAGPGAGSCKDSHSAQVGRATLSHPAGGIDVIVKRPRPRNAWRRLVQLLPPSRSRRGWRAGHALLHRDVPTARPLAALERRLGPLVLDSLLLTEAVPGGVDLETLLRREHAARSPRDWARLKRELTPLLVAHVRRMQERGFEHRDCKASNILVVRQPRPMLLWIDMDGVRRAGWRARAGRLRALVRLHVSLLGVPGLGRTDRARFLRGYCARFGARPDAWRALWRRLEPRSAAKVRAKAARTRWKLARYGRP